MIIIGHTPPKCNPKSKKFTFFHALSVSFSPVFFPAEKDRRTACSGPKKQSLIHFTRARISAFGMTPMAWFTFWPFWNTISVGMAVMPN